MRTVFFSHETKKGFTLLELVVVLAISGLIFGGLWGLLTSGSAQLQSQSAAQQYRKAIDATRRMLSSGVAVDGSGANDFDPDSYCPSSSNPGCTNTPVALSLDVLTDTQNGFLSPNFAHLTGGSYYDSYGHQIQIMIRKLDNSNRRWQFMVYSTIPSGMQEISDKSGAQIAALIGADGGFVYSADTEGCLTGTSAANKACGAFNSFAILLSDMGVANGSGRVATLSFTSDSTLTDAPWLMRLDDPNDIFNTMSANLDFKTSAGLKLMMKGNTLNMGDDDDAATSWTAGAFNMNGAQFNMRSGTINMNAAGGPDTGGGIIDMDSGTITNLGGASVCPSAPCHLSGGNTTFGFNDLDINTSQGINITTGGASVNINTTGAPSDIALDIQATGKAEIFQAGQFIYSSDMRLKQNIRPIPNALDKILKLRGMNYEWGTNHAKDVGLLAQDVQKVFPELVTDTEGAKGIDYGKLIAPMVEAIRQLKQENDTLRARLNTVEGQLSSH
jgi:prepilin-type N-terminal cleavage/methylation domain-containing protein